MYGRLVGPAHTSALTVTINLAKALREHGDLAEAADLFQAALGRIDPGDKGRRAQFIAAGLGLGRTLTDQHRAAEALPLLQRALELSRERFGREDWRTGEAALALGLCLASSGQQVRAEPLLREAASTLELARRGHPRLAQQAAAALAKWTRAPRRQAGGS